MDLNLFRSSLVEKMPVLDEATFSGRRAGSLPIAVSTSGKSSLSIPNGVVKAAAPLNPKFHIPKTLLHPSTLNSKSRLVNPTGISGLEMGRSENIQEHQLHCNQAVVGVALAWGQTLNPLVLSSILPITIADMDSATIFTQVQSKSTYYVRNKTDRHTKL
ncbi:hypothetical protein YC2023_011247 [Brassica napus]